MWSSRALDLPVEYDRAYMEHRQRGASCWKRAAGLETGPIVLRYGSAWTSGSNFAILLRCVLRGGKVRWYCVCILLRCKCILTLTISRPFSLLCRVVLCVDTIITLLLFLTTTALLSLLYIILLLLYSSLLLFHQNCR